MTGPVPGTSGIKPTSKVDRESFIRMSEAEAEVMQLRAKLANATKALEPFAKLADAYDAAHIQRIRRHFDEGAPEPKPHSDGHRVSVSMGELRGAQSALRSLKPDRGGNG